MTTETKKSLREMVMSSPLAEKGQLITDSIKVYVEKKRIYDKAEQELDTASGAVVGAVNAYNDARRELFVSLWKESGFGWCTYGFESNYNDIHIPDNKGRAVPTGDLKPFYMRGPRWVGSYGERYTERYTETSVFEVHWLCNECQDAYGERLRAVEEGMGIGVLGYFNKDSVWTPLDPNTVDLKVEVPHIIPKSLEEDWGIPPKLSIPYKFKNWGPNEDHPELVFEPDQ